MDLIYSTQPTDLDKSMGINIIYNTFAKNALATCSLGSNKLVSPYKPEAYNSEESQKVK